MAKRKTLAIGTLGFLLIAGVVIVIVLGAMGYFNKKGGGGGPSFGPMSGGGHGSLTPTANVCMPPTVTNVSYLGASQKIEVNFMPSPSPGCDTQFNRSIGYKVQYYDGNGNRVGGESGVRGIDSVNMIYVEAPGRSRVSPVVGVTYTGDISIGYDSGNSNISYSAPYHFSYTP